MYHPPAYADRDRLAPTLRQGYGIVVCHPARAGPIGGPLTSQVRGDSDGRNLARFRSAIPGPGRRGCMTIIIISGYEPATDHDSSMPATGSRMWPGTSADPDSLTDAARS